MESMSDRGSIYAPGSSVPSIAGTVSTLTFRERVFALACRVVARSNQHKERLLALHDHEPTNTRKFLAFKKGEEFELVDAMKHDGWWLAKHLVTKKKGLVPSSFVARECDIELLEWCDLDCSRADAEKKLNESKVPEPGAKESVAQLAPGSFIIRPSSTNRNYSQALSLSIKSGRENAEGQKIIHHYEIERKEGQMRIKFHLRDDYTEVEFPSLTKLIQYYARYPSAVRPRLTYSVKKNRDAWEIDIREIDKGELLGKGHFGEVYLGTLDGRSAAVKKLIITAEFTAAEYTKEAATARRLSHENIVRIIGVCTTDKNFFYIVTEFLSGGDLRKYLERYANENGPKLSERQYLEIARKIASAMTHLESNKIVHRDLAARNVLVGQSLDIIKLADFGLARPLDEKTYYRSQRTEFPFKWTAPEAWVLHGPDKSIIQEGKSSSASDVWSFAVVLWEVYSMGAAPYGVKSNHDVFEYLKEKNNIPLERPEKCPENTIYDQLMCRCWSREATERPTFSAILALLEDYSNLEMGVE